MIQIGDICKTVGAGRAKYVKVIGKSGITLWICKALYNKKLINTAYYDRELVPVLRLKEKR